MACTSPHCEIEGHYHKRPALTGADKRLKEKKDENEVKKKKKKSRKPLWLRCHIHLKHSDCGGPTLHGHCFHKPGDHWDVELMAATMLHELARSEHTLHDHTPAASRGTNNSSFQKSFFDPTDWDAFQIPAEASPRSSEAQSSSTHTVSSDDSSSEDEDEKQQVSTPGKARRKELRRQAEKDKDRRWNDAFTRSAHNLSTIPEDSEDEAEGYSSVSSEEDVEDEGDDEQESTHSLPSTPRTRRRYSYAQTADDLQDVNTHECTTDSCEVSTADGKSQSNEEDSPGDESQRTTSRRETVDDLRFPTVTILLQGPHGTNQFRFKRALLRACSYLPGLTLQKGVTDREVSELLTNSVTYLPAHADQLVDSTLWGRDSGNRRTHSTVRGDAQLMSHLQKYFNSSFQAVVDQKIVTLVMNNPASAKGALITADGNISKLLQLCAQQCVELAVEECRNKNELPVSTLCNIFNNPELKTNTVMHCMNLMLLRQLRIDQALPKNSSTLSFPRRVPIP
jgi:hypothetical protein